MITTANAITTAKILKLRVHSNAPPLIDSLSSDQIEESKTSMGQNMNRRTITSIPDKKTLVLKLKSYGDTIIKADAQHAERVKSLCDRTPSDEESFGRTASIEFGRNPSNEELSYGRTASMGFGRTDSMEFGRTDSMEFGRTSSNEELSFGRTASVGDTITTSDCIDELTKAQKIQDRIVAIHAGFSSWRLKHSRLTDGTDDHIGFFGVVELTRNRRPEYPIIHRGDRCMTETEIKGINIQHVLNAAVASNSARPENKWYRSPDAAICHPDSETDYASTVQDELSLFDDILSSGRTSETIAFFIENFLGELAGEAITDRESLTRKEFKVKVDEEIAKRHALLSSLLIKVIMPLLCRFRSRDKGCVFPIGIFYDYLLKIKYAKEAMMHGSTYGNSNIFTECEKVQHENFREIMIEGAIAYAEEASDEYENGWSVYEKDMMLQGFMAAPDGLTHAQKFNLYEYRESLLDELHAVLEAIQTEIKGVSKK